jgi:hypothetical protein
MPAQPGPLDIRFTATLGKVTGFLTGRTLEACRGREVMTRDIVNS